MIGEVKIYKTYNNSEELIHSENNIIVDGILEVLEKSTIFDRPDLDIKTVAKNYENI